MHREELREVEEEHWTGGGFANDLSKQGCSCEPVGRHNAETVELDEPIDSGTWNKSSCHQILGLEKGETQWVLYLFSACLISPVSSFLPFF